MTCNVGKREGVFRVLLGLWMIRRGYRNASFSGLLGFVPILTGLSGYCPLSSVMGRNTCENEKDTLLYSMTGMELEEVLPAQQPDKKLEAISS